VNVNTKCKHKTAQTATRVSPRQNSLPGARFPQLALRAALHAACVVVAEYACMRADPSFCRRSGTCGALDSHSIISPMASLAVQPSSALAAVTGDSKRPASPAPETQQQQQQPPPSKEARTDREPRLHAVTCCYVVPVTSATDAHFKLCRMRNYNKTLSEGLLNNGYGFHQVNLALVRARGDGYPLDGAMFRWRDPCRPDDEPKSGWVDDLTHVLFSPDYETPALWFRWVIPSSIRDDKDDESEPPSPMMEVISDLGGVLASAVYAQVKFLGKTHKDLTGFKAGVNTDFIEEAVQLMQRTLASVCRHKNLLVRHKSEVEAELEALLKEVEEEAAATKPAARGCKRKAPEACDDSE